jgi:hypothetical protein
VSLINKITSGTVGGLVGGIIPVDKLSLSILFNPSDDGFAIDFTTADGLFQDSSFTTPVTASNDLVGGARDESGNGNDYIQATTSNKPEWIEGEGVQSIDAGDLLGNTFGATLSDFTVIAYFEDVGAATTSHVIFRAIINSNNEARMMKDASNNFITYTRYSGITNSASGGSISDGADYTAVSRYNDTSGQVYCQLNDNTPGTSTRTLSSNYGTDHRILENYFAPLHRIIVIDRALSDDEAENAKTMVLDGWAS